MYRIIKIKSEKRSLLKAFNNGLTSSVNEVEISLERTFKVLGLFPITQKRVASGALHIKYDINEFLKIGDIFDYTKYPMLKIKRMD